MSDRLSPEREVEIREMCRGAARMAPRGWMATAQELLAELAAVRAENALLQRKVASLKAQQEQDDAEYAGVIAERDALQKRLHDAAMTRTWRNEDGKKFVFVEDIAPALLGRTPGTEANR